MSSSTEEHEHLRLGEPEAHDDSSDPRDHDDERFDMDSPLEQEDGDHTSENIPSSTDLHDGRSGIARLNLDEPQDPSSSHPGPSTGSQALDSHPSDEGDTSGSHEGAVDNIHAPPPLDRALGENEQSAGSSTISEGSTHADEGTDPATDRNSQTGQDEGDPVAHRMLSTTMPADANDSIVSSRNDSDLPPSPPIDRTMHNLRGDTSPSFVLPEWQPDHRAVHCPICETPFGMFVRKHHCRKCGRVVCGSCSPHRITIPHSYIVRPPWDQRIADIYALPGAPEGGERVRLCNPCVPDPNTAPPQMPPADGRSSHQRSQSNFGAHAAAHPYILPEPSSHHRSRNRSASMHAGWPESSQLGPNRDPALHNYQNSQGFRAGSTQYARYAPAARFDPRGRQIPQWTQPLIPGASTTPFDQILNRPLPRSPPAIAEEDECPVCHQELPRRDLPNFESLRESHIDNCIISHGSLGNGLQASSTGTSSGRQTRLILYKATEKECLGDEECSICLEEFKGGDSMGRLECLCRFHRSCIESWFRAHPGRCPVHQHDSHGY